LIDLANEGGGLESLPPIPEKQFGADDQRRLEEIKTLRRNDPNKYEADKTLQLEELDLLEGVGSGQAPAQADASRPQGADRLQAIRELRRNDPRAYDGYARLQAEELSLIEAQIASRPSEPSTPVTTSQTAPAESAAPSGERMSKAALAETTAEVVDEVVAPIKPLDPARFMQATFARNEFCITLPPGTPFEALHDPKFFKSVVTRLGLGDLIEVRSADLAEWGMFMVVESEHNALHVAVRELFRKQLAPADLSKSVGPAYTVSYSGDIARGWQVHRNADSKLMKDSFRRKEDAQHYVTGDLTPRRLS
jgi:hypothetical protein